MNIVIRLLFFMISLCIIASPYSQVIEVSMNMHESIDWQVKSDNFNLFSKLKQYNTPPRFKAKLERSSTGEYGLTNKEIQTLSSFWISGWDIRLGAISNQKAHDLIIPVTMIEKGQNCAHLGKLLLNASTGHYQLEITNGICKYLKFKLSLNGTGKIINKPLGTIQKTSKDRQDNSNKGEAIVLSPNGLSILNDLQGRKGIKMSGIITAKGSRRVCFDEERRPVLCQDHLYPSYSLSKSLFTPFALMQSQKDLGSHIREGSFLKCLPSSYQRTFKRWNDVTFESLLDMNTGFYRSGIHRRDEEGTVKNNFLLLYDKEAKRRGSLGFEKKSEQGEIFVYQTSNHYILFPALEECYRKDLKFSGDFDLFDHLMAKIFEVNGISKDRYQSLRDWTFSSTGKIVQENQGSALAGYGQFYTPNSFVKVAKLPMKYKSALMINTAPEEMKKRLEVSIPYLEGKTYYDNGFWFSEVVIKGKKTVLTHAMGYGGNVVIYHPNGNIFYQISDSGEFPDLKKVGKLLAEIK